MSNILLISVPFIPHQRAMSKKTTIYVLFKEYPDPNGRGKSVPYIQDSMDYLVQQEQLMRDWTDISDVLDYFNYEPSNKYYDEDNINGLLEFASTFSEEYPNVEETIMSEMQSIGLTSWRTNAVEKSETYFFEQNDVTTHLLGDMAQREINRKTILQKIDQDTQGQLSPQDKEYEPCVLLQKGAVVTKQGMLEIGMARGSCIHLQSVNDICGTHRWLSQNRFPPRNYVFNAKHGDAHHQAQMFKNRHGNWEMAAQLLTDTRETENLLRMAVGDSVVGDLWYCDNANDCYIYFENQGKTPQHEYHAYHLHEREKNYDKINFAKLKKILF